MALIYGELSASEKAQLAALPAVSASAARNLTAGAGLTGGGTLAADRTFDVVAADATIVVNANDIQLGLVAAANLPFATVQTVLAGATSAIDINGQKITNSAAPVASSDLTNKGYVDAASAGAKSWKLSVRLSTLGDVALTGIQTLDGVLGASGDRIGVIAQTVPSENGIYVMAAGAWARSSDANTSALVKAGLAFFVEEGTVNHDAGMLLITDNPIVLDTTSLTFTQFTGLGTITAGDGMTKTGNTLDVVANGDGSIVVNPNDIQVGVLASDAQHGVRGGGSQHAVADGSTAGFMSNTDFTKLAGISPLAAALTASAPVNVTKAAAAVGSATDAARADHKHDITTAAASALAVGGSNAEGSAASLARSDHTHALPAFGSTSGTFAQGSDLRFSQQTVTLQTADTTLTAADSEDLQSNEGAGAPVVLTLPPAAANLVAEIYVQEANLFTFQAAAGDTIRVRNLLSATGGTAASDIVGSSLKLVAINATEWIATDVGGTWDVN